MDAGTGMFRLTQFELPDRLDILLSHCHLDHVFGLTTLLVVCHNRPKMDIHLWGEGEKIDAIKNHLLNPHLFPVPLPVTWHQIKVGDTFDLPGIKVQTRAQPHPGGSVAYAMSDERNRIVYATDTVGDCSKEFATWADHPNLLIHECYFPASLAKMAEMTGHTHSDRLIEIIGAVQPSQTLVTHVNPLAVDVDPIGIEDIAQRSDAAVILAEDQLTITVA